MPTYEYECSHCGDHFEVSQKMTDRALEACPKCQGKLKRLIGSGSGVIFKGSGFYATDYRKKTKNEPPVKAENCPQAKEGCHGCPHNK
jgi:putative FmdB family regulatory protein